MLLQIAMVVLTELVPFSIRPDMLDILKASASFPGLVTFMLLKLCLIGGEPAWVSMSILRWRDPGYPRGNYDLHGIHWGPHLQVKAKEGLCTRNTQNQI